jgi:predicted molibdopterin-dependent oxidoreductase YjgC
MDKRRVDEGVVRGRRFAIEVDGKKIVAHEGETIAAALTAAGVRAYRTTAKRHEPRGMYCGIGLCYECLMVINGVPNTRACQTLATPGVRIETQTGVGALEGMR